MNLIIEKFIIIFRVQNEYDCILVLQKRISIYYKNNCFIIKYKLSMPRTIILNIYAIIPVVFIHIVANLSTIVVDDKKYIFNDIIWPLFLVTIDVAMFYCH